MKVLVIDVGGTHVKLRVSDRKEQREFASGPTMTPKRMMSGVRKLVADWGYDVVSIGYPGAVLRNRPVHEPWNLGKGWIGFNFEAAFKCSVKVINDAAMQALGSYRGGKMLFLGLGTGLGSALIAESIVEPMELGHLPYKKATFEDYVGIRALMKFGKKKWRRCVADVVRRLMAAVEPDEVVLGGGNAKKLKELPPGSRLGDNANAFLGGFRLWQETGTSSVKLNRIVAHANGPESFSRKQGGQIKHGTDRRNAGRGSVNSTRSMEVSHDTLQESRKGTSSGGRREKPGGTAEQGCLHCGPSAVTGIYQQRKRMTLTYPILKVPPRPVAGHRAGKSRDACPLAERRFFHSRGSHTAG